MKCMGPGTHNDDSHMYAPSLCIFYVQINSVGYTTLRMKELEIICVKHIYKNIMDIKILGRPGNDLSNSAPNGI
jgi:hypothetical protein